MSATAAATPTPTLPPTLARTLTEAPTAATTWRIDPSHSQVEFEVKHMVFAKVRGRFEALEGTVVIGPAEDLARSGTEVVIEASSIDTGQAQRDEHLRSADFFDVARFPHLRFRSEGVSRKADGGLALEGALTIRDVTRRVELEVTETGRGKDPWGNARIGFAASTLIDRRDYGLTWNQALEAGGILVGNDVRITIEVQAVLQA